MAINQDLVGLERKINNLSGSPLPMEKAKYKAWLSQQDFIAFLKKNVNEDDVILYASFGDPGNHVYIYGVLVSSNKLYPLDVDDLMEWGCNPTSQWGIKGWPGDEKNNEICSPFDFSGSKTLNGADQLIFLRRFEGRIQEKTYFDVSELLLQPHGLHYVQERSAYCCINDEGDIQDVIKIMCNPGEGNQNKIVTINKNVLRKHLQITKCHFVRFFESRRLPGEFLSVTPTQKLLKSKSINYRRSYFGDTQSMIRGFQIIDSSEIKVAKSVTQVKYEKFIAHDFRNQRITRISCDPKMLANYFVESKLLFEMTPAFFNPEVLIRYKNDPEKYTLTESSISCRGAWDLQCYHVNEAGQVFSYLIYLSRLPYKEQKYWVSFNEKPKGSISRSALMTDFYGRFDLSYEPLFSIKMRLEKLSQQNLPWWKLRDHKGLAQLHYPLTESLKEWSDAIHTLNKIINEGFVESYFRTKLLALKVDMTTEDRKRWRAIRMLKEYVILKSTNLTGVIYNPFHELNDLRTKFHGHTSGAEAEKKRFDLVKKYGSLSTQFKELVQRCDEALRLLDDLISGDLHT